MIILSKLLLRNNTIWTVMSIVLTTSRQIITQNFLWHTLRYRSYFSPTVHKNIKIRRLINCFNFFIKCKVFFWIYWDHITHKKKIQFIWIVPSEHFCPPPTVKKLINQKNESQNLLKCLILVMS